MQVKIVFVTPSIKTGGGNRVFIELANQLCGTHDISIVYPNNSSEKNTFSSNAKLKYVCIGKVASTKFKKLQNLFRCIRYLNSLPSDSILILTDPIFCLLTWMLKHKSRIYRFIQADDYRIYDDGNVLGKGLKLKLYKYFCLRSYQLHINYIFNSRFVYDRFCQDAKRNDVSYSLIHPAINSGVFKPVERGASPFHGCSLCLIARKHPLKGLETFIHVFHSLPSGLRHQITNVTLVSHDDLSGFDTRGMNVVRPTCDADIAKVYQSADIFISTSWWEGFGLPPLEAMACGCAVITSKSGGVNEFAEEGKNCLMFEPENEHELTENLNILINDIVLRKRLAIAGVRTASAFDWKKSANQLLNILCLPPQL